MNSPTSYELADVIRMGSAHTPVYVVDLLDVLRSIDWAYQAGWLSKEHGLSLLQRIVDDRKITSNLDVVDKGTLNSDLVMSLLQYCELAVLSTKDKFSKSVH